MKGFRYRQAYAILEKRIEAGELPRGQYKFVIGLHEVKPKVQGCSLNAIQERALASIVRGCTPA